MPIKRIENALISVFYKDGLELLVRTLIEQGTQIYSTGGTQQFIEELGFSCTSVESVTGFPSIFGGRVKTLHPAIFGGILWRRNNEGDATQALEHHIPSFDLVVVDLYPFSETVASGAEHQAIIEKIDIGGVSLIRAAAKNYNDVAVISNRSQYKKVSDWLAQAQGLNLEQRHQLAAEAFDETSAYDTAISAYFSGSFGGNNLKVSQGPATSLRYGENPHQKGVYYGDLSQMLNQLSGKELSYNNLVDIDAAIDLIAEFESDFQKGLKAFAILKHTNPCGVATCSTVVNAYKLALQADPVSAFGGVLITNGIIDIDAATEINKLFVEVLIAPDYTPNALELLKSKGNKIILKQKTSKTDKWQYRSLLNGVLAQERDLATESVANFEAVTLRRPTGEEDRAMVFANKIVKHTKSNAIVLAIDGQMLASGIGQTSRVDALRQAINKARSFNLNLTGAVMASDAFFPFADCVEIAHEAGISATVQPGGSKRDQESIDFCNENNMAMVFTGVRHFKH